MLIAAEQLGLGSVWLGLHPLTERVDGVRRLLTIPESIVPFALLAVGRPAERKEPAERYDATRVHRERW
jgi:nitroreductase